MNGIKGKYSKNDYEGGNLMIHDAPTTSAQMIICSRTNDTSTDVKYPSERYTSTKNLGDGSASLIFEGYDHVENKKVIIKKISKREYWRKELDILRKISNNTSGKLLKFVDFFESTRYSYIVTEFYTGFDLFEHIDLNVPYPEKKGLALILEMAKCIKECHDNNILHLDIKYENFMVRSDKLFGRSINGKGGEGDVGIVLIDFGHAESIPEGESIEKLRRGFSYGTNYYICPEGNYEKIHSSKSDIWSLGVCLSLALTGDYPFTGNDDDYYRNCLIENVSLSKYIGPKLVGLLKACLSYYPFDRPNIDTFIYNVEYIMEYGSNSSFFSRD